MRNVMTLGLFQVNRVGMGLAHMVHGTAMSKAVATTRPWNLYMRNHASDAQAEIYICAVTWSDVAGISIDDSSFQTS
jgi:hypothetical protein